jgi:hypothetical protein
MGNHIGHKKAQIKKPPRQPHKYGDPKKPSQRIRDWLAAIHNRKAVGMEKGSEARRLISLASRE